MTQRAQHRASRLSFLISELFFFTLKELRAVLFPGMLIFLIFISNYVSIPGLYRYDFLFFGAVVAQVALVATGLETKDEAKTIVIFHLIGLALELFKTHPSVGSWSYPEPGYTKVAGVPLYSGFMYAAVGSYIAGAWKMLRLRLTNHPSYAASLVLCFFIYLNFFTNRFVWDYRPVLFAAILLLFRNTWVYFTPRNTEHRMPLVLGFLLTGFFVWIAENIATFYGAWKYPGQIHAWEAVSLHKITSWFLLVIISFIVVANLKHFKELRRAKKSAV